MRDKTPLQTWRPCWVQRGQLQIAGLIWSMKDRDKMSLEPYKALSLSRESRWN